jgi:hypothetical protein
VTSACTITSAPDNFPKTSGPTRGRAVRRSFIPPVTSGRAWGSFDSLIDQRKAWTASAMQCDQDYELDTCDMEPSL